MPIKLNAFGIMTCCFFFISTKIVFAQPTPTPPPKTVPNETKNKIDPIATGLRGKPIYVSALKSVDISPDGKHVAAGSGKGAVVLWDVESSKHIWTRPAVKGWAFDLQFNSEGSRLAIAGDDNLIVLLDTNNGNVLNFTNHHNNDVHGVRFFDKNRKIVSCSDDTTVRIWDLAENNSHLAKGHTKQVTAVAVSPNENFIASASRDKTIRLWDPQTLKLLGTLNGHTADVMAIDFDPSSKYLVSAGYDKTVRIWDIETQTEIIKFDDFQEWVFATKFHPDGELIAIGDGQGKLTIRNWKTDEIVHQELFSSDIPSLDFSDKGDLLALVTIETEAILLKQENGKWIKQSSLPVQKPEGTSLRKQSFHLPPEELLELINTLNDPEHPNWEPYLGKTALTDSGIPVAILEPLQKLSLSAPQQELLDRTLARIIKREENPNLTPELIAAVKPRLELAAWFDTRSVSMTNMPGKKFVAPNVKRHFISRLPKQINGKLPP